MRLFLPILLVFLSISMVDGALSGIQFFQDLMALILTPQKIKETEEINCGRLLAMTSSAPPDGLTYFLTGMYKCHGWNSGEEVNPDESFWGRLGTFIRALIALPVGLD